MPERRYHRSVRHPLTLCVLFFLCRAAPAAAAPNPADAGQPPPPPPRVFLLNGGELHAARQRLRANEPDLIPARDRLVRDAHDAMKLGPFTVTSDKRLPPSGDRHDYMSQAPYWWPDASKPDGLPYIQRDGVRNPEIYKLTDAARLKQMSSTVELLSLAYYFTGDESFADRAALLLRTWFLDDATRMNPNLQYAQGIPGVNTGRGTGIIESLYLIYVVDAAGLLGGSAHWTEADAGALRDWFGKYLSWMMQSQYGQDEAAAKNNHGTYFDVQAATFALFTGDDKLARQILEAVPAKRLATQVEPDGRQPQELRRTKAWSYSCMNCRGLMLLARLGEHVKLDLWHHETENGGSVLKTITYLAPFATGEANWPHEQINGFRPDAGVTILRRAAREYPAELKPYVDKLPRLPADATEPLVGVRLIGNPADSK